MGNPVAFRKGLSSRAVAIKAAVIKEDERVRAGFHNFRHSLASSLVKLKCDPKTVPGIQRREDVRTTMQLYAQSDQESAPKPVHPAPQVSSTPLAPTWLPRIAVTED